MPYQEIWVSPVVFTEYKGVTIYHVYKDDNYNDSVRTYSFGYQEDCNDEDHHSFDVRDLESYNAELDKQYPHYVPDGESEDKESYLMKVIHEAIDNGELTTEGVRGNDF